MSRGEAFGLRMPVAVLRTRCDYCGGSSIEHGTVSALMPLLTPEQLRGMSDGLSMMGTAADADPDAWVCRSCGNLGLFSRWFPSWD